MLVLLSLIAGIYLLIQLTFTYFRPEQPNRPFNVAMDKLMKEYNVPEPPRRMHVYNYIFTSFLVSGLSLGLRYSEKYIQNEKRRKELEQEHMNSELAMLKNQVSPHFFFNTLNNIYSLIELSKDDAQKAVLKLSKLMRYLLYESEHSETFLSHEVDFMKNYIDLMKLRVNESVDLKVFFPDEAKNIVLPPLLFVSFIENAFKHGVSNREPSFIHIDMSCKGDTIHFTCRNSIFRQKQEKIENASGIGLENIRKRLALLFHEQHKLSISEKDHIFEVVLDIKLPATKAI